VSRGVDSSNKLQVTRFGNSFQSAKRKTGYTIGEILVCLLSMTSMDRGRLVVYASKMKHMLNLVSLRYSLVSQALLLVCYFR
jgi:hypothetical protein